MKRRPHKRVDRSPVEVREVAGGKVGLAMGIGYVLLDRGQALCLAFAILRAVRW